MEGIHRLRVPDSGAFADAFLAWFWGILRHKQISELRRRKRVSARLQERGEECYPAQGNDALATLVKSSLGLLEDAAPAEARVLHRRFMEGRELRELASELGVSVPTACRRVQAALAKFRGCMNVMISV
jgi:DNA-directed RNA polymerase specialized sigma24 family protein